MTTDTTTGRGLEPLMNIEELAEYLGVPVTTIYDWRVAGKGPCAIRVGRSLKFAVSDVRVGLTAQELQVSLFVAQGLSNREVAGHLFLSPRTIDFHLRNVFSKLGVSSRAELARLQLD